MNCPKCGHEITRRRKRCEVCGQDISVYERLIRTSNSYYNKGLERARIRDLTGAALMLKKSLELNKENTDARNLLGLVYFEMGEVVAALGEWVISVNLSPEDNPAEEFLKKVQSDTVAFDTLNQSIRKFNIALNNANRQDDDLAVLQLKRVISMNPKYVKALLLLALIYLKNCEYEKARRCLVRVQKIDVANVTALRYLEEIRLHTQNGSQPVQEGPKDVEESYMASQIAPVSTYKEDKPNFIAFLTFFLGILIGVAVIYYMAVPNIRKSIMAEYNQKERDYSSVLSVKDVKISSLESNIRILETKIDDLERTLRNETGYHVTDYEPLIEQLYMYQALLKNEDATEEDLEEMTEEIAALDMSTMTELSAKTLYADMLSDMRTRTATAYATQGMQYYSAAQYDAACYPLEKAYKYAPEDPEIIYPLARVYHHLDNFVKAKELYEILVTEHQDSERSQEAATYLGYVNDALEVQKQQ